MTDSALAVFSASGWTNREYYGDANILFEHDMYVLFCFVLFCFVLFCFVLFCFVLFCFVLFCFYFIFNYYYRNNLHMDGFVRHLLLATLAENDVALSAENLKYS